MVFEVMEQYRNERRRIEEREEDPVEEEMENVFHWLSVAVSPVYIRKRRKKEEKRRKKDETMFFYLYVCSQLFLIFAGFQYVYMLKGGNKNRKNKKTRGMKNFSHVLSPSFLMSVKCRFNFFKKKR
jgi:hypothetical protein